MRAALPATLTAALALAACAPETPELSEPSAGSSAGLVPADRAAKIALGAEHATAVGLYAALKARANGGAPLSLDDMPDWTGLWQRVGPPFFDPDQPQGVLTSAKLKPEPLAELTRRRELSAQGIEYDPISDCSPPGFPRWLAIPFLRELIVTPGQDMILVMSRSIAQGSLAGVVTAAGVSVGLVGHSILAALGLGAVLQASEGLFLALKLLGAAYLFWMGLQLLRSPPAQIAASQGTAKALPRLFLDGALSNISNPKIAVFYFAFLPQFVAPDAAHPTLAIFVLGLLFALLTFVVKGPVGLFAGLLSGWLRANPSALKWIYRSSGAVLLGLGVKLALERKA